MVPLSFLRVPYPPETIFCGLQLEGGWRKVPFSHRKIKFVSNFGWNCPVTAYKILEDPAVHQRSISFSSFLVLATHFLKLNLYQTKYGSFRGISLLWHSMKDQSYPLLWSSSVTWLWYVNIYAAGGGNMKVTQMRQTMGWVSFIQFFLWSSLKVIYFITCKFRDHLRIITRAVA